MTYLLVAFAALMFGLYNVFIKLSSSHIEAVLGAVVLQFVAALVGLSLLLYMKFTGSDIYSSPKGLGLAVAVGNPLIIGGSLLVTTGAGVFFMREHISLTQFIAIGLIAAGVGLMAWAAGR